MGKRTLTPTNETQVVCPGCKKPYDPGCDWQQGRCPQHPPLLPGIVKFFKQLFNRKK